MMKTNEIMFKVPASPMIHYETENKNKVEYVEFCRKKAQVSSKVANYVLTQLEHSMIPSKKYNSKNQE